MGGQPMWRNKNIAIGEKQTKKGYCTRFYSSECPQFQHDTSIPTFDYYTRFYPSTAKAPSSNASILTCG